MVQTQFSKTDFQNFIKPFAGKLKARLPAERVERFQKGMTAFIKHVVSDFSNYEFYLGSSESMDGSIVLSYWEDESAAGPVFYFFRDALNEEKC